MIRMIYIIWIMILPVRGVYYYQHKTLFPVASIALIPSSLPTPDPPEKTICRGGTTLIGTAHRSTLDCESDEPVNPRYTRKARRGGGWEGLQGREESGKVRREDGSS